MALSPVSWTGSKRRVAERIIAKFPPSYGTYFELFCGSAAVFFRLQPKKAVLNDVNAELMNFYEVLRDNAIELEKNFDGMSINKETFMQIREQERISKLKRAVRFYYLNKSCFAGNWQTNSKGKFTTAFARWGRTLPLKKIQLINQFLNSINISFYSQDFETFLPQIKPDDLVYLDPPYFVNKNSSKNEYTKNWFDNKDQERLLNFCKQLPCKFFLSNSYSEQVVEFYKGFNVEIYDVARDLSKGKRKFQEILVSN